MDDIRELKRRMLRALNEDTLDQMKSSEDDSSGMVVDKPIKDMTVRDTLKLTRDYNSGKKKVDNNNVPIKLSANEEKREQEKMNNFFENYNVIIDYKPLQVYNHGVFWGGSIDGQVQWVFKVTAYEESSGLDLNIMDGFQKDDEEIQDIIKNLENYYDTFYKYWRDSGVARDNMIDKG